jgi:hypothetical protein
MRLAEGSELSGQTVPNTQVYIDSAINKAEKLKLESRNLKKILTKLVLQIDQLDFKDRDKIDGYYPTFMLSNKTS